MVKVMGVMSACYHVSAADTVCVTLLFYLLVKKLQEFSWRFYRLYLFQRGVHVLDVDIHRAAAEHSLSKRQDKLFIVYAVEVELVLLNIEKALSGDEFLLRKKISGE